MGLFDAAKKALNSEQGEKISDGVLDKAGQIASQKTGGKHDDKITKAKDAADRALGDNRGDSGGKTGGGTGR